MAESSRRAAGIAGADRLTSPELIGTQVGGRYRLEELVATTPGSATADAVWRGVDDVLARPVTVLLALKGRSASRRLAAAVAASRLTHPAIAAIYDAAEDDGILYVVSEWVGGESLRAELADGPLRPGWVVSVGSAVAQALAAAHEQGIVHGQVDLDSIRVTSGGLVRLTGFGRHVAGSATTVDVRSLGQVLYAALTARWPHVDGGAPPDGQLEAAPTVDGHVCAPRQVRAGIPRDLDAVVVRALDLHRDPQRNPQEQLDAAALAAALSELPAEAHDLETTSLPATATRRARPVVPTWLRWVGGVLSLVLLAVVARQLGIYVGTVPSANKGSLPVIAEPSPGTAAATTVKPVRVTSYDPPPGDGHEGDASIAFATDGETSTPWETDTYQGSPRMGGIKSGVGLLVDFGQSVTLSQVVLALPQPGTSLELRAADAVAPTAAGFALLATSTNAGTSVTLTPPKGTAHRYWLVWLTSLPRIGSGTYRGGISEMVFRR